MSGEAVRNVWVEKAVERLRAMDGVAEETLKDGGAALELDNNGRTARLVVPPPSDDYDTQKTLCREMGEALTQIGIAEGMEFVPPPRKGRAISPESIALRKRQRAAFDAWQEIWRTIRKADNALDVEREISQMWDYY
jgi:hypothetical protein